MCEKERECVREREREGVWVCVKKSFVIFADWDYDKEISQ